MSDLAKYLRFGRESKLDFATCDLDQLAAAAQFRMAQVDAMPEEWRRFVHEYGLKNAQDFRTKGYSARDAARLIETRRRERFNAASLEILAEGIEL
jgi:hypothetical protein